MSERRANPAMWGGLFLAAIAAIAGLRQSDAINPTTGYLLLALALGVGALWLRAMTAYRSRTGCITPAVRRYNRAMMLSGLGYVLGLGVATFVYQRYEPGSYPTFALALMPVLPIFGMIFAMGRYLVEESDEYLRYRTTVASLAGLALVLGAGSFWGFLEEFALAPHLPGWWAVPIWAVGMGLAQGWMAFANRAKDDARSGEGA